jgi:hypothetical protein
MQQTAQTRTDRPASTGTPWFGSAYRMPSRIKSHKALKMLKAVHGHRFYLLSEASYSDKSFTKLSDLTPCSKVPSTVTQKWPPMCLGHLPPYTAECVRKLISGGVRNDLRGKLLGVKDESEKKRTGARWPRFSLFALGRCQSLSRTKVKTLEGAETRAAG